MYPGRPPAAAAHRQALVLDRLLALAHTLPIAVRRRWPLAVLAWGLATRAAFAALGLNLVSLTFAVLVYVYTVAAHRPRRVSLAGLAATESLLVLVLDSRPEEARKALVAVEATSRQAMVEMRRLLGVFRQEAEPRGSLAPVPGLAEVEALTDVVRHAGPATARVAVRSSPGQVALEVVDDGHGPRDQERGGLGIAGMRERAALYGGTLEAGPLPGRGFRVAATLPVEEPP